MESIRFSASKKIIPDAYHGTSKDLAEKIIKENKFEIRCSDDCYLGSGVYFYESSVEHARIWARRKFKKQEIGVVKTTVDLGNCLDLHNIEHRNYLKNVKNKLCKVDDTISDSLIINFIIKYSKVTIDSVRFTHIMVHYDKIYAESRFYEFSQLIICMKNSSKILNMELT